MIIDTNLCTRGSHNLKCNQLHQMEDNPNFSLLKAIANISLILYEIFNDFNHFFDNTDGKTSTEK